MDGRKDSRAWKAAQKPHLAKRSDLGSSPLRTITPKSHPKRHRDSPGAQLRRSDQGPKRSVDEVEISGAGAGGPSSKKARTQSSRTKNDLCNMAEMSNAGAPEEDVRQDTPSAALGDLSFTHDVTSMNIISSSKVEAKVTRILDVLSSFSFAPTSKPSIVLLCAKASTASKMITIVEIAKRELALKGLRWYQYNRLEQTMAEKRAEKVTTIWGREVAADLDEDLDMTAKSDSAFETLKTPLERAIEGRPKVRAIPFMSIYLSRVPVEKLMAAYGYYLLLSVLCSADNNQ
ncbi:MAG: hypothetical protein M1818_005116 [Claussenomyces sp. TS43310]|nr:MAG: hypothetical protein M1818_005116 [Claussenomyces sp. TS43310]